MTAPFIHLRTRSPYSMLEGALKIPDMVDKATSWQMPALGLTDTNNLCGGLAFSEAMAGAGVQPIIGCTLSVCLGRSTHPGQITQTIDGTLVVLARDEAGYKNLMKLSSAAFLDVAATDDPHVTWETLQAHAEGLIALTGGPDGFINQMIVSGEEDDAARWLQALSDLYGDSLYIELQRHGTDAEVLAENYLVPYAYQHDIPLVATNEPYFLYEGMYRAHDALLAISESSYIAAKDRRKVTPQHYLKSPEDMVELFSDLPEAIKNTAEIARRCYYRPVPSKPILPRFGSGDQSEADILREQAEEGLRNRLASIELAAPEQDYWDRLEVELDVINFVGFPGYFLIVSDFIKWAKEHDIPVGPGRGSGAGSLVAWSLLITDLDPLRYGLLFERFLNKERVSMPDFDVDFCQERRGEVISYVQKKYGEDQVAQIITFGTLQARAVVRDVGRVMQLPLGQVDRLAKLVPANPANPVTLAQAIKMEDRLAEARDQDPDVKRLLDVALQLEGLFRNASTHAAGVVIGDRPLTELIPLYRDPRSDIPATQYTMKLAEKAGLVKFDFLGLKTLTVIKRALNYLEEQGRGFDIDRIALDDPDPYTLLAKGDSIGVFQLESSGMRDVLRRMKPDTVEELTALISLYRPGPMENIGTYIDRKFKREPVDYLHPDLKDILTETYGVIIYQEQVMQIAQILGGYSLGDADLLRRAMGKKDKAVMAQQKSRFLEGARAKGVDERKADYIFELVSKFAGYGFNKSHAAAYAMIAYRTAYIKAKYPTEFMAALMSLDIANTDKLASFHQECVRLDVDILAPDINRSGADFEVKDGKILYALGALKNVGLSAMQHVVEERNANGPFKDLFDFARRISTQHVNKRAIENLARAGAFDSLEPNRAKVLASAQVLLQIGQRSAEERSSAQVSLFGDEPEIMAEPDLAEATPWSAIEQLDEELSAIGFYFTGHPLEQYASAFEKRNIVLSDALAERVKEGHKSARLVGIVRKRQERVSQKNNSRFAYVALSDPKGSYEAFVGADLLARTRDILQTGNMVEITAKVEDAGGELKIFSDAIQLLDEALSRNTAGFKVYLRGVEALAPFHETLQSLPTDLAKRRGPMHLIVPMNDNREAEFRLPDSYPVDAAFRGALKTAPGVELIEDI